MTIDDSDKETYPDDGQGTDISKDRGEMSELKVERTAGVKCLYSTKQKRVVVVYAKQHSVAAATKKFSLPRTTINHWMVDGYF